MSTTLDALEKPLPKPARDPLGYAHARTLEALLEALLALEYLEKGYTRNAAGKAFQAWRAVLAALLALEKDRVLERLETDEEKKWFLERGLTRLPTTRLTAFALILEELGYKGIKDLTSSALELHDYQYHGPDPDAALSKYPDRRTAARATKLMVSRILETVENTLKPRLEKMGAWDEKLEDALKKLREALKA